MSLVQLTESFAISGARAIAAKLSTYSACAICVLPEDFPDYGGSSVAHCLDLRQHKMRTETMGQADAMKGVSDIALSNVNMIPVLDLNA